MHWALTIKTSGAPVNTNIFLLVSKPGENYKAEMAELQSELQNEGLRTKHTRFLRRNHDVTWRHKDKMQVLASSYKNYKEFYKNYKEFRQNYKEILCNFGFLNILKLQNGIFPMPTAGRADT